MAYNNQSSGSSKSSRNNLVVPQARQSMNNLKYEIANEYGVNLKQGYNGDLTSRDAGTVGGYMVKHMIEAQERKHAGSTSTSSR